MGKKKELKRLARRIAQSINGSVSTGRPPSPSGLSRGNGSQGDPGGHQRASAGSAPDLGASVLDPVAFDSYGQATAGLDVSSPKYVGLRHPDFLAKAASAGRNVGTTLADYFREKAYQESNPTLVRGYLARAAEADRLSGGADLARHYREKAMRESNPMLARGYLSLANDAEAGQ